MENLHGRGMEWNSEGIGGIMQFGNSEGKLRGRG